MGIPKNIFLSLFVILIFSQNTYSQSAKTIYFISGQGSDHRLFDSLRIDSAYTLRFIDYKMPEKKATMAEFAKEIATNIDTTEKFILVGVSLGGMICAELNEILNAEKVILISSVKNRNEYPFGYSFQKYVPFYEIIPAPLLFEGAKFFQPIYEPDRDKFKETFKSMLNAKNPEYIKRTIRLIMKWDRVSNSKDIIHIHGTNDNTLPYDKIEKVDYTVVDGSHMMTLTRAKEISQILNEILKN